MKDSSKSVGRRRVDMGDHFTRLLLWGFGLCSSERNRRLIENCLPLFEYLTLKHNDIILRKSSNRHVWLIISGECHCSLEEGSLRFSAGEWVRWDFLACPKDIIVRVASKGATFLRIPERDFRDRLPVALTKHMDRRIRGYAHIYQSSFRNALRISQSIVPEIRNPVGAPTSARLLPIREINKYVNDENVHIECERERIRLHKLSLTAR